MISADELRQYMASQLAEDRKHKSIRARGATLEEALAQAAVELGLPLKSLDYELVQRGSRGTMGVGRREWVITAYEGKRGRAAARVEVRPQAAASAGEAVKERDGEVFLHLNSEGVFLKVTRPTAGGRGPTSGRRWSAWPSATSASTTPAWSPGWSSTPTGNTSRWASSPTIPAPRPP